MIGVYIETRISVKFSAHSHLVLDMLSTDRVIVVQALVDGWWVMLSKDAGQIQIIR